jgi:phosphate-selective porin OprO/OprP
VVAGVNTTLDSNGFRVRSNDGDFAIKIGTRLHAEASGHKGDLPLDSQPIDGSELRRARIETSGSFHDDWSWAGEVDIADNLSAIKDFWLAYTMPGGTRLTVGAQKQPYTLNVEMSSNDIPFIERSVDNFLLLPFVDRAVGIRAEQSGAHWFAAGGLFGEAVNPNVTEDDEGRGIVGRFVYAPIIAKDEVLHLGVRAARRTPSDADPSFRIRDETTHMSSLRLVDTGDIDQVEQNVLTGLEASYARGPFSLTGEYTALETSRFDLPTLNFDSWSVFGTWSLTGESRAASYRIDAGEFKRLQPGTEFNPRNGTWGALELALRYAHLDANDRDIVGGEEDVLTTGLNWYMNTNVRLMFEWSRILSTDGSNELREAAEGLNIFQFRTQYTF